MTWATANRLLELVWSCQPSNTRQNVSFTSLQNRLKTPLIEFCHILTAMILIAFIHRCWRQVTFQLMFVTWRFVSFKTSCQSSSETTGIHPSLRQLIPQPSQSRFNTIYSIIKSPRYQIYHVDRHLLVAATVSFAKLRLRECCERVSPAAAAPSAGVCSCHCIQSRTHSLQWFFTSHQLCTRPIARLQCVSFKIIILSSLKSLSFCLLCQFSVDLLETLWRKPVYTSQRSNNKEQ